MLPSVLVRQNRDMRSRLFLAPWWVQALESGVFLGALVAIWGTLEDHQEWGWAVLSGTISGMLFGPFVAWGSVRERTRWRRAVGRDLSDAELNIVHRATTKGPVPSDPRLRLATVRSARYGLDKRDNEGSAGVIGLVIVAVLIWLQFRDSLWWLVPVAPLAFAGYEIWAEPRRLRARINVLSRDPDQHPL